MEYLTLDRLKQESYNYYGKIKGYAVPWNYESFYRDVAMGLSGTHALATVLWDLDWYSSDFGFAGLVEHKIYSKSIDWFLLDACNYIGTDTAKKVKEIIEHFVCIANVYLINNCQGSMPNFSKLDAEYQDSL